MNIWFVLWVFIATFILGTTIWSYTILVRQKKAWEEFAKKHSLRYESQAVLKSPVLRGLFNGIPVEIFSDSQISGKSREKGTRTIIQMSLKSPMPTEGAISSMAFKNFVDGLALPDTYQGEGGLNLSADVYNRVKNEAAIKPFFTAERISALNAILSIKTAPTLLIFGTSETVLRIESSDPFDDKSKLERFLTKATDTAKIISI